MTSKTKLSLSRYYFGVNEVAHKGVTTTTSLGSEADDFIENLNKRVSYKSGKIPIEHGYRPDLTSHIFYDSVRYWWMLLQYNNINDPFEGFKVQDRILIPKLR